MFDFVTFIVKLCSVVIIWYGIVEEFNDFLLWLQIAQEKFLDNQSLPKINMLKGLRVRAGGVILGQKSKFILFIL